MPAPAIPAPLHHPSRRALRAIVGLALLACAALLTLDATAHAQTASGGQIVGTLPPGGGGQALVVWTGGTVDALLAAVLEPHITDDDATGFGRGRTPGAPSRWTRDKSANWVRLSPELVCEVAFDQMQGDRFRHGTTFQHWRVDKPPRTCTYDQLVSAVPTELRQVFRA